MSRKWTNNEIVLAMEYFYQCPEPMHTDSHVMCRKMAALLDRSPSALDKILRNIKQAHTGIAGLPNASSLIRDLDKRYRNDRQGLLQEAARIRRENGWPPLSCRS
jgi:hypothetical protein